MKQVEVSILGQVYILACPEGGEALLAQAVEAVDREMTHIRDAGKVRARERIAVLAALNLGYQLAGRPAAAQASTQVAVQATPGGGETAGTQVDPQAASKADAAIDAMLQRIDAALGEDGQLL